MSRRIPHVLVFLLCGVCVPRLSLAQALVAHWTFNEGAGASVRDSIGGFHGTVSATGATWLPAEGALKLEDGYVTMGDVLDIGAGPYTLAVWVRTTAATGLQTFITRHQSGVTAGYILAANNDNSYGVDGKAWLYNYSHLATPSTSTTVTDGAWHLIAGTKDGATACIYVDDGPCESAVAQQALGAVAAPLVIGGLKASGVAAYSDFAIADARIYDGALAQEAIEAIYRLGPNGGGATRPEFDGDGTTDVSVFRPSTGEWFVVRSSSGFTAAMPTVTFGQAGDQPLMGDFDGDAKRDVAVYRPATGTWFWLKSSAGNAVYDYKGWGMEPQGDVPVAGDFDGDGKTDPTVYRAQYGTWFILQSSTSYTTYRAVGWGESTDVPMPGDYDGDGKTDAAVYRPSTGEWFVLTAASGFAAALPTVVFGQPGDQPVRGDFDGDGRTDRATYRPATGTWFWLKSSTDNTAYEYVGFGMQSQGDVPVPGDYDGDGQTDPCVYRPSYGTWFVLGSRSAFTSYRALGWGLATDIPLGGKQ